MAWTWHVAAVVALSLMVAPAVAQSNAGEFGPILQEVRLLRQAIENFGRANAVAQISLGRLNIQEQRMIAAARQRETIGLQLSQVTARLEQSAKEAKALEELDLSGRNREQREDYARAVRNYEHEAASLELRQQKLAVDEAEAAQHLALEQARWAELNQRLDDLERAMALKRQ